MPTRGYTPDQDWAEWSEDDLILFEMHRAAIVAEDEARPDRPVNAFGLGPITLPGQPREATEAARDRLKARGLLEIVGTTFSGDHPIDTYRLSPMGQRVALAAPSPLPRPGV